ncbi:Lsr2 family protein [Amycolatopsis sp. NPDC051045]|uniref:histone-like nucleoid-structuring protein Lsr2 n=1 Tax=Amycolatopsis sp. NPDC051045 TaxID=3156922 RepID=UPI00341BFCEB
MTKRVTIEILDDTDGSPAEQTVPFGLDGVAYEIDLSTTNANALREALSPYVVSARRTGGRRIKGAVGQPTDSTKQEPKPSTSYTATHDIRTWARENGYEVADQGRIAKTIIEAYRSSRRHLSTETNQKHQTRTTAKRRPKPRK